MAETGPMLVGIGRPEGAPKKKFIQKVKEAFLPKYAKERWYEKHAKEIEEFKAIESQLTPEQRAEAMQKLESRATRGAWGRVVAWWGGTAATLTAAVFGIRFSRKLVMDETFRTALKEKSFTIPIFKKEVRFGEKLAGAGEKGREWLDALQDRMAGVREKAATARDELQKRADVAREALKNRKKKKGEPPSAPPINLVEFYRTLTDNPLTKMDEAMPVAKVLEGLKGKSHEALEEAFHSSSKEDIAGLFFEAAEKKGAWKPLHLVDGVFQEGVTIRPGTLIDFWDDIREFAQLGLVNVRDVAPGNISIEPTDKLIEFIQQHIPKK